MALKTYSQWYFLACAAAQGGIPGSQALTPPHPPTPPKTAKKTLDLIRNNNINNNNKQVNKRWAKTCVVSANKATLKSRWRLEKTKRNKNMK